MYLSIKSSIKKSILKKYDVLWNYMLCQSNSTYSLAESSELYSTCLHFELPWARSSLAPVSQCCRVAAQCLLRTTSECTRQASEGVPGDHHLDKKTLVFQHT